MSKLEYIILGLFVFLLGFFFSVPQTGKNKTLNPALKIESEAFYCAGDWNPVWSIRIITTEAIWSRKGAFTSRSPIYFSSWPLSTTGLVPVRWVWICCQWHPVVFCLWSLLLIPAVRLSTTRTSCAHVWRFEEQSIQSRWDFLRMWRLHTMWVSMWFEF